MNKLCIYALILLPTHYAISMESNELDNFPLFDPAFFTEDPSTINSNPSELENANGETILKLKLGQSRNQPEQTNKVNNQNQIPKDSKNDDWTKSKSATNYSGIPCLRNCGYYYKPQANTKATRRPMHNVLNCLRKHHMTRHNESIQFPHLSTYIKHYLAINPHTNRTATTRPNSKKTNSKRRLKSTAGNLNADTCTP